MTLFRLCMSYISCACVMNHASRVMAHVSSVMWYQSWLMCFMWFELWVITRHDSCVICHVISVMTHVCHLSRDMSHESCVLSWVLTNAFWVKWSIMLFYLTWVIHKHTHPLSHTNPNTRNVPEVICSKYVPTCARTHAHIHSHPPIHARPHTHTRTRTFIHVFICILESKYTHAD